MAVTGRIDLGNVDDFQAQVLSLIESGKSGSEFLVLDLSGLEYISSVGLRALMRAAKASRGQNGMLVVSTYGRGVGEVLKIARIEFVVELFKNLDDAVKFLNTKRHPT